MVKLSIRVIYLYLFSFVGLLIAVMGTIRLVDLGMKTFIFPKADIYTIYVDDSMKSQEEQMKRQLEDQERNRQREFSSAISMIVVGVPLYLYHWKTINKEKN